MSFPAVQEKAPEVEEPSRGAQSVASNVDLGRSGDFHRDMMRT